MGFSWNVSIYICLGIVASLPLVGIGHLNWLKLINFGLINLGLLYLFIRNKVDIVSIDNKQISNNSFIGQKNWQKILVYLYYLFIITQFYPTNYGIYNKIIELTLIIISIFCLIVVILAWFTKQHEEGYQIYATIYHNFIDKSILFTIIIVFIIIMFSRDLFIENIRFDFIMREVGIAFVFIMLYISISSNIDGFMPLPLKMMNLLPYWVLLIASLASISGLIFALYALIIIEKGQSSLISNNIEESAKNFVEYENKYSYLNFPIDTEKIYPILARNMLSKNIETYTSQAQLLLDTALENISDISPNYLVNDDLVMGYIELANAQSISANYPMAIRSYSQVLRLVYDPGIVFRHIQKLPIARINEIWSGDPYLVLTDYENVKKIQLIPAIKSEGLSHEITAHKLCKDCSPNGRQAEVLKVRYEMQSSFSNDHQLYDYWFLNSDFYITKPSMPTGIRVFVKVAVEDSPVHVRLVIQYLGENSYNTIYSDTAIKDDNWEMLSIIDLNKIETLRHINQIGIGIVGPNSGESIEVYIFDFQLFTYDQ